MKAIRDIFLLALIPISGITAANPTQTSERKHPNIIILLSDDQGYGDFSITGNKNLQTPNIDKMAERGVMFTRFYVSPVCSPTRSELLTGRYHARSGVYSTQSRGEYMDLDESTIAEVFKAAGYKTGIFGKWHNGMQYPYHPNARGFDDFYGFSAGHLANYFSPMLEHNGKLIKGEGFIANDLTNKAMVFIEKNKKKPFFVYIPYNTPHSPMQVPDEDWSRFKDKELVMRGTQPERENIDHTRAALALCENIDWNVGRLMHMLKKNKLEENTIILYFNDNGPNGNRWRDGMKGQKGSTDEGGVRSPLFMKWPGVIPQGIKIHEITSVMDILPTLADLAGIPVKTNHPIDGISLKPLILEGKSEHQDRIIISQWLEKISLRSQQYRYNQEGKLFDMVADPGQNVDISRDHPALVAEYKALIEKWKSDVNLSQLVQKRDYLIGHPDFKYTQLPASDGTPSGGIERSNKWTSSSFFTKWNSLDGKISFPVEVIEEGEFEVEIYYTCKKGQEGSEVQLSFGENKLITKITEAFESDYIDVKYDRAERDNSYMKDFKRKQAGTIYLNKGKGELILQAIRIPGKEVMDFGTLMLTRKK